MNQKRTSHSTNPGIGTLCERAGVNNPRLAATLMARRMLNEYGKKDPPFVPHELCQLRNIEASEQYLIDCDARLLPVFDGYLAEVHAEHSRERKNFSFCHEIGHTFLLRGPSELADNSLACRPDGSRSFGLAERLCNTVAAELLMPRRVFTDVASSHRPGLCSLKEIAIVFQVSLEAVISRILEFDIWRCVCLYFTGTLSADRRLELKPAGAQLPATIAKNPLMAAALVFEIQNVFASRPLSDELEIMLSGRKSTRLSFGNLRTVFTLESYHTKGASESRFCVLVSSQTDDCAMQVPSVVEGQMQLEFL